VEEGCAVSLLRAENFDNSIEQDGIRLKIFPTLQVIGGVFILADERQLKPSTKYLRNIVLDFEFLIRI